MFLNIAVVVFGLLAAQVYLDWTRDKKQRNQERDQYTTLYPVFRESHVRIAEMEAVQARAKSNQMRANQSSETIEEAVKNRHVSDDLFAQAMEVCEAELETQWLWFRHARMMEANLAVLTGKLTREESLNLAYENGVSRPILGMVIEARALADDWKRRIETGDTSSGSEGRYSNPW